MFKIKSCCFLLLFIWFFNFNNAFAMKRGHDDECATATEDQAKAKRLKVKACLEEENEDDFMSRLDTLSTKEKGVQDWQRKYLLRFLLSDPGSSLAVVDALLSDKNIMDLFQPVSDILFPSKKVPEFIARSNGELKELLDGELVKRLYYLDKYGCMNILNKCESDTLRYIVLKNSGGVGDTEYRDDGALCFRGKALPQGMESEDQNDSRYFVVWDNEQEKPVLLTDEKVRACQALDMKSALKPVIEKVEEVAKSMPALKNSHTVLSDEGEKRLGVVQRFGTGVDAITGLTYRYFLVKGQNEVLSLSLAEVATGSAEVKWIDPAILINPPRPGVALIEYDLNAEDNRNVIITAKYSNGEASEGYAYVFSRMPDGGWRESARFESGSQYKIGSISIDYPMLRHSKYMMGVFIVKNDRLEYWLKQEQIMMFERKLNLPVREGLEIEDEKPEISLEGGYVIVDDKIKSISHMWDLLDSSGQNTVGEVIELPLTTYQREGDLMMPR